MNPYQDSSSSQQQQQHQQLQQSSQQFISQEQHSQQRISRTEHTVSRQVTQQRGQSSIGARSGDCVVENRVKNAKKDFFILRKDHSRNVKLSDEKMRCDLRKSIYR